jgi:phospholipid transport system substrate-binding protein
VFKRLCSAIVAATLIGLVSTPVLSTEATPTKKIEQYYDVLYDAWKNAAQLGFQGRYDLLEPAVRETFDMPYIAQFTVGRYWNNLSDAQKETLINAVTRLSTATYAARFDTYSGEQFKVLNEQPTTRGDLLVLTNIIDSDGDPVDINYLMRDQNDDWLIVDIYLKGSISELATRRSEFTSVIRHANRCVG